MGYFTNNHNFAFGIDLSRFNSSPDGSVGVDFDAIAAHQPKVTFLGMRAGISWGYQDPCYAHYQAEAARIGVCRLAYHVVYPGQNPRAQMDNFLRIVGDAALKVVRLVLDLELDFGLPRAQITQTAAECVALLQARTGRFPILYSRASWVDQHLDVSALPQVEWWLAQYRFSRPAPLYTPEYPCPPALPHGVHTWLIHQTAEKAPAIGSGANRYMDYNRWNGSEADLRRYFGQAEASICPLDGQACDGRWG